MHTLLASGDRPAADEVLAAVADAGDWVTAAWLACLHPGSDGRARAARALAPRLRAGGGTADLARAGRLRRRGRRREARALRDRYLDDLVASSLEPARNRKVG